MAKYSVEFKLQVVQEYLEGPLGYKLLTEKHTISSTSILRDWIRAYREFGLEGLKRKDKKTTYSVQFKVDILHFMKQTGASYSDTAITFPYRKLEQKFPRKWDCRPETTAKGASFND